MARIVINIEDGQDGGVDVKIDADPPFKVSEDRTHLIATTPAEEAALSALDTIHECLSPTGFKLITHSLEPDTQETN